MADKINPGTNVVIAGIRGVFPVKTCKVQGRGFTYTVVGKKASFPSRDVRKATSKEVADATVKRKAAEAKKAAEVEDTAERALATAEAGPLVRESEDGCPAL